MGGEAGARAEAGREAGAGDEVDLGEGNVERIKFCAACGTSIPWEAAFCSSCGASQTAPHGGQAQSEPPATASVPPKKVSNVATGMGCLGVLAFVLVMCSQMAKQGDSGSGSGGAHWYDGGTLHRATMGEWMQATRANRLATCGDIIANKYLRAGSPRLADDVRGEAEDLMACIDAAYGGSKMDHLKVAEIAAACMILSDSGK